MKITKRKWGKLLYILRRTKLNKATWPFVFNLAKRFMYGVHRDARKDIPYPTTLMLELTNKCNLHCVTCPREYDYGKAMRLGNMEKALAFKIIDECYPYLQSIGLTGMGETLFAPVLQEVAAYIKAKKPSIVIFISTNANMPDFIEKITPVLPFIDTVQISTDGVNDIYENVRHGASFELLARNIAALAPLAAAHGVDMMFNMVLTELNYRAMPSVVEFAAQNGIRFVNFTYFNLASVTDIPIGYYQFFASAGFQQMLAETKVMARKYPEIEVTGLDFPGNPGIRKCPLVWNHFQINYDGEVPPCCAKPFSKEYSFGNVSDRPVISVLNSAKAKEFRRCWVENQPHEFCRKCHYVHL